jgi:hypothetical protein
MIRTIETDFKIAVLILIVLAALEVTRRGHRHVRRRRHASFTVRENVPVGRSSWISFGHRFRR